MHPDVSIRALSHSDRTSSSKSLSHSAWRAYLSKPSVRSVSLLSSWILQLISVTKNLDTQVVKTTLVTLHSLRPGSPCVWNISTVAFCFAYTPLNSVPPSVLSARFTVFLMGARFTVSTIWRGFWFSYVSWWISHHWPRISFNVKIFIRKIWWISRSVFFLPRASFRTFPIITSYILTGQPNLQITQNHYVSTIKGYRGQVQSAWNRTQQWIIELPRAPQKVYFLSPPSFL